MQKFMSKILVVVPGIVIVTLATIFFSLSPSSVSAQTPMGDEHTQQVVINNEQDQQVVANDGHAQQAATGNEQTQHAPNHQVKEGRVTQILESGKKHFLMDWPSFKC